MAGVQKLEGGAAEATSQAQITVPGQCARGPVERSPNAVSGPGQRPSRFHRMPFSWVSDSRAMLSSSDWMKIWLSATMRRPLRLRVVEGSRGQAGSWHVLQTRGLHLHRDVDMLLICQGVGDGNDHGSVDGGKAAEVFGPFEAEPLGRMPG